jgi:nitrate reductase NapE component
LTPEGHVRELQSVSEIETYVRSQRKQERSSFIIVVIVLYPALLLAAQALGAHSIEAWLARFPGLGGLDLVLSGLALDASAFVLDFIAVIAAIWFVVSMENGDREAKRLRELRKIAADRNMVNELRQK